MSLHDATASLERFRVVLVEPQGDRNIGSVARGMMNFGFSSLYLVRNCLKQANIFPGEHIT